jgi:hypothetical protein
MIMEEETKLLLMEKIMGLRDSLHHAFVEEVHTLIKSGIITEENFSTPVILGTAIEKMADKFLKATGRETQLYKDLKGIK